MKKFGKCMAILSCLMSLSAITLFGCSSQGGGSLLQDDVFINVDSLNGGQFSERINKDNNKYYRQYLGLDADQYDKDIFDMLNHYHVDYAYEMNAVTNDVVKKDKVFGGWYLDKNCSNGNYLTKATYTKLRDEIGNEKSVQLFARWLEPGTRELVFEVDGTNFNFIDKTQVVNNQIRYTFKQNEYPTNFVGPNVQINEEYASTNNLQFKKWKVDFNGLRYDYKDLKFLSITNQYTDVGLESSYHNCSYQNIFKDGVEKPYALFKTSTISQNYESIKIFFDENGGTWDPNFGKHLDRNIDKYTSISKDSDFDYTIYYDFVNHGINSVQQDSNHTNIPFLPSTDDITKEGKVFAGWYLDKDCTPNQYFTKNTFKTKIFPNRKNLGFEINLYARWINPGEREILFENNNNIERISFTSIDDEVVVSHNLDGWKINFNGLLFDYSLGEYTFVPETVIDPSSPQYNPIFNVPIDEKYISMFNYENFIKNGAEKPYALLTK